MTGVSLFLSLSFVCGMCACVMDVHKKVDLDACAVVRVCAGQRVESDVFLILHLIH